MRLAEKDAEKIIAAISQFIPKNEHVELHLYGSRVDDSAKGGDIDLLLYAAKSNVAASLSLKKTYILVAIKDAIGDQKIDLKITTFDKIQDEPFLDLISPTSILLHTWPATDSPTN